VNAQEAALAVLLDAADPDLVVAVQTLVLAGTARWVWDPEHDGVVGLCRHGDYRHGKPVALVVVYVEDEDFEIGSEGVEALAALDRIYNDDPPTRL
jgi:hypothetical protein